MNHSKNGETLIFLIWGQSVIALFGSLFFSEVMDYVPCELCWYQRILMYPLVIIYGMSMIKKDLSMAFPGLILSGIGIFVSIYHYLIQKLPAFHEATESCGIIPCNTAYVNYFGFITIPFLAGVAFIVIFVLHITLLKQHRGK
ncbi:disulfide oxidoreductase [Virgibacillus necropolis]|uniref:Probable disulfide formation protein n=1 Tax=Virgibacillus necropolis TaxID=163877 RepID=A0A221MFX6_9BACI|nr:disulfide oxidoreductase [Virgibacillus necropolis]ASN06573.1 disulfide bond formation protein B [Virgibacillus necropolis]